MPLPHERWNGIYSPAPMRLLVDIPSEIWDQRAYPKNDYDHVDKSLLLILTWELDALAVDPNGPETQQRRALKGARQLHSNIGTELAFEDLLLDNATTGQLRLVGDYNSNREVVPRTTDGRRLGTHSVHQESGDVYHREVAIDVVLPVDRPGDVKFLDYIGRATQRVITYTLEVVEVNVVFQESLTMYMGAAVMGQPVTTLEWIVSE